MKESIFMLSLLSAMTLCTYAQESQGECDKYASNYDKTYCFAKLFIETDKELNRVYQELRSVLKGSVKQQLLEVQRDWIKYRDQTCSSSDGIINVACSYEINRRRTEYLRDRLLECKAGTCRQDMIGRKSWD